VKRRGEEGAGTAGRGLEVEGPGLVEVLGLVEALGFAATALLGIGLRLMAKASEGAEGALGAVLVAVAVEVDALAAVLAAVVSAVEDEAVAAVVRAREVVAIREVREPDSTAAYNLV
jgi:hypothetical protein